MPLAETSLGIWRRPGSTRRGRVSSTGGAPGYGTGGLNGSEGPFFFSCFFSFKSTSGLLSFGVAGCLQIFVLTASETSFERYNALVSSPSTAASSISSACALDGQFSRFNGFMRIIAHLVAGFEGLCYQTRALKIFVLPKLASDKTPEACALLSRERNARALREEGTV